MVAEMPRNAARRGAHAAGQGMLIALALAASLPAVSQALVPLDDRELSSVSGRDGVSFDFRNFSLSGDARITYTMPAPSTASLWVGNLYAARSDDPKREFSDPYRLDILSRSGLADYFNIAFPANSDGAARWQFAFDFGLHADGVDFQAGAMLFKDLVFYGGGLQLSTPVNGDGTAFGLGLRIDIGNLLLRPRGRDDITQADPAAVGEQMNLRGIHVGAASADGIWLNAPWQLADVTTQPGIFNAVTDASGNSRLHIGIGWPTGMDGAPWGSLVVDNITFKSDVSGTLDLGSSRIGAMQLQYVDIKFRP